MIWLIYGEASTMMLVYILIFPKKTYYSFKNRLLVFFLLFSPHLSEIIHMIKSDHNVILLNINSALYANIGPGFWKFNASLLEEKYKDLEDKHLKRDSIKFKIRGNTIKYSKLKAKKTREREKGTKQKILNIKHN